jgi:hypothetical protein
MVERRIFTAVKAIQLSKYHPYFLLIASESADKRRCFANKAEYDTFLLCDLSEFVQKHRALSGKVRLVVV